MTTTALWKMYEPANDAFFMRQLFQRANTYSHSDDFLVKHFGPTVQFAFGFFQSICDTVSFGGKSMIEGTALWMNEDERAYEFFCENALATYYSLKMLVLLPFMAGASIFAPESTVGQLEYPLCASRAVEEIEPDTIAPLESQINDLNIQLNLRNESILLLQQNVIRLNEKNTELINKNNELIERDQDLEMKCNEFSDTVGFILKTMEQSEEDEEDQFTTPTKIQGTLKKVNTPGKLGTPMKRIEEVLKSVLNEIEIEGNSPRNLIINLTAKNEIEN